MCEYVKSVSQNRRDSMKMIKALAIAAVACVMAFGMFFVLELSDITYRATGLEVSQVNNEIRATWDKVKCENYLLAVFDENGLVDKAFVNDESYVYKNAEVGKEYKIQVAARNTDGDFSDEDTEIMEVKKPQNISIEPSEGDVFTESSFNLNATADGDGKISYVSANEDIVTVNKKGKVEIKGDGTTEIKVEVAETEEMAAAEVVISLNAGEKYEGEMPELPNAIESEAFKCAWPYGTPKSVYKYNGGSATAYFKDSIDRVYPDHNSWGGTQPGKGASCDVFVGTVVRASGYDPNFPRALKGDYKYLPSSSKFKKVSPSQIQSGDIMLRKGHIQIYVEDDSGTGYIANAHFKLKTYGIIEKKNPSLSRYTIYHPTGDCTAPLSEGDEGQDVKQAQEFLKWAGYYDKKVDGKYGSGVVKAVKNFQEDSGTKATGKFGSTCIDKATKYKRNTIEIVEY